MVQKNIRTPNIQPQLCCGEMQLIRRLRRHLPFQGKVKTGLRPTSREGEQGEVGELFFIVFYSV